MIDLGVVKTLLVWCLHMRRDDLVSMQIIS